MIAHQLLAIIVSTVTISANHRYNDVSSFTYHMYNLNAIYKPYFLNEGCTKIELYNVYCLFHKWTIEDQEQIISEMHLCCIRFSNKSSAQYFHLEVNFQSKSRRNVDHGEYSGWCWNPKFKSIMECWHRNKPACS